MAKNVNERMTKACEASAVKYIKTSEEFKKQRKLLLEDSALVYFDNLQQLLYFDSGWMENGEGSQARRLLGDMAREISERKKFANDLQTVVFWTAMVSMVMRRRNSRSLAISEGIMFNRLSFA